MNLKRAELWIQVGRPQLAFDELGRLSELAWGHPWTRRVVEALERSSPGVTVEVGNEPLVLSGGDASVAQQHRV
jgi:hypothetical protein